MYLPYIEWRTLYFHLQYKHSGMFANCKYNYEELSYPQNLKMCDPILVTLLEMWPIIKSIQLWKCDPIQRHITISLL